MLYDTAHTQRNDGTTIMRCTRNVRRAKDVPSSANSDTLPVWSNGTNPDTLRGNLTSLPLEQKEEKPCPMRSRSSP